MIHFYLCLLLISVVSCETSGDGASVGQEKRAIIGGFGSHGGVARGFFVYLNMSGILVGNGANYLFKPGHSWPCGGTLIHAYFVVSAAHCVEAHADDGYGKLHVKAVAHWRDFTVAGSPERQYLVHAWYSHLMRADIALLQLREPVNRNHVPLATFLKPCEEDLSLPPGSRLRLVGMGCIDIFATVWPETLQEVDLQITYTARGLCHGYYSQQTGVLRQYEFCAIGVAPPFSPARSGDMQRIRSSCDGDSGSPGFQREENGNAVCLYGVLIGSYRKKNEKKFISGGDRQDIMQETYFTRVGPFSSWIDTIVHQYESGQEVDVPMTRTRYGFIMRP